VSFNKTHRTNLGGKVKANIQSICTVSKHRYRLPFVMKNGRNTAGQFSAGNPGRPKGARNKATIAIESLLQGQAEALTQTAVTKKHWREIALL